MKILLFSAICWSLTSLQWKWQRCMSYSWFAKQCYSVFIVFCGFSNLMIPSGALVAVTQLGSCQTGVKILYSALVRILCISNKACCAVPRKQVKEVPVK
jgi:hypothetical protein